MAVYRSFLDELNDENSFTQWLEEPDLYGSEQLGAFFDGYHYRPGRVGDIRNSVKLGVRLVIVLRGKNFIQLFDFQIYKKNSSKDVESQDVDKYNYVKI